MTHLRQATIIGGSGFIGRSLRHKLESEGWQCAVPAKEDPALWEVDLGHVFYCAGLTADYLQRPFDAVEAHVSLLNRILQAAKFQSLVYLSSTRLYDSQPGTLATEDTPLILNPVNSRHLYDLSKALGESLCCTASQGRARVARLSCVYNDHTDESGFLPELMRQILAHMANPHSDGGISLTVDTSPHYSRDYIHLDDVLSALVAIAIHGKEPIYNVASGDNVTNSRLFATLERLSGIRLEAKLNNEAAPPPVISIQRLTGELNIHPTRILEKLPLIFPKK